MDSEKTWQATVAELAEANGWHVDVSMAPVKFNEPQELADRHKPGDKIPVVDRRGNQIGYAIVASPTPQDLYDEWVSSLDVATGHDCSEAFAAGYAAGQALKRPESGEA